MKRISIILFIFVTIVVMLLLGFSFIHMTFNVNEWHIVSRIVFIALLFFWTFVAVRNLNDD